MPILDIKSNGELRAGNSVFDETRASDMNLNAVIKAELSGRSSCDRQSDLTSVTTSMRKAREIFRHSSERYQKQAANK